MSPTELEEAYKSFSGNFQRSIPDGLITVNLQLLQELDLLKNIDTDPVGSDTLSQQFHVVETSEKVTLFNEKFAVWIVPQIQTDLPSTLVMIALIQNLKPHLEIVYTTAGVYNTPRYILKVLQHFLSEVLDTEALLSTIVKKKK